MDGLNTNLCVNKNRTFYLNLEKFAEIPDQVWLRSNYLLHPLLEIIILIILFIIYRFAPNYR